VLLSTNPPSFFIVVCRFLEVEFFYSPSPLFSVTALATDN